MAVPSDDAAKQRIISHMNADHRDSVIRYAEHYAKASRFAARNALLKDISLDKMTISASGRTLIVPLNPPMGGYREARERLVDMDRDSIKGLQRSSITIKEYRAPKGFHAVVFAVCAGTYLLLSRRDNVSPGSLPYELLFKHIPQFAAFVARVRDLVLWPMIAIHLSEAYLMAKKLEKHSVPLFSVLWWMWIVSCFTEGVGSFQRTSAIVEEKRQKQEKH